MGRVIDTTLFGLFHDYFKVYLPKQRRCSPHTFRAYQSVMETFMDFVKDQRCIDLSAVTFEILDKKCFPCTWTVWNQRAAVFQRETTG